MACPPGRFRGNVTGNGTAVTTCIDCPVGRYRPRDLGVTADDCSLCPVGTYSNVTGATSISGCTRCPAGMVAEEPGMALCKCITPHSCALTLSNNGETATYFSNGVDYYRESVPFVGRA